MEIIKYIQTNIGWLKDVVTLLFAGVAIIISILTYRRAKATIFQPIRSETIRKQSAIFSELLELLAKNRNIDNGLDYLGIARISAFKLLDDLGFRFSNHEELSEKINRDISDWIPVGKSKILRDVEIINTYEKDKEEPNEEIGKIRFKEYKEGKYEIEKIFLSKKHTDFVDRLRKMAYSPFLPKNISKVFDDLFKDISENLYIHLKDVLTEFLKEFREKEEVQKKGLLLDFVGIYNDFNHKRKHHRTYLDRINSEVRLLLMIDSKW